jgi:hypothetical protein
VYPRAAYSWRRASPNAVEFSEASICRSMSPSCGDTPQCRAHPSKVPAAGMRGELCVCVCVCVHMHAHVCICMYLVHMCF